MSIKMLGSWEKEEVGFIIRAMRAYREAVFVGRMEDIVRIII